MRTLILVSATVLLASACLVGTTVSSYAPALGPAGAQVRLRLTSGERLEGELLEVGPTAILILTRREELIRVRNDRIRSGSSAKLGFSGGNLRGSRRERLRLISRFPQGVAPELEMRLLRAHRRNAVREA